MRNTHLRKENKEKNSIDCCPSDDVPIGYEVHPVYHTQQGVQEGEHHGDIRYIDYLGRLEKAETVEGEVVTQYPSVRGRRV